MEKVRCSVSFLPLKNNNLVVHPAVDRQFNVSKTLDYQFDLQQLSADSVEYLQRQTPLHAIKISKNEYRFFAGWQWLPHCYSHDIDKILVISYRGIDKYDIRKSAWMYLLSMQIHSLNHRTNVAQFAKIIDKSEESISMLKASLLSSGFYSSSRVLTKKLSNVSKSLLRTQFKNLKQQATTSNKLSILDKISKANKNEP